MSDRKTALRILEALRRGPVGDTGVLVGSSGLFGFETRVPALTEDIDIAVPEATVAHHGREIVEALQAQGFEHQPGTASFLGPENAVFDLLGHGDAEEGDHTGGTDALRVMVFEDLTRLLATPQTTMELPSGGRALRPASSRPIFPGRNRSTGSPRRVSSPQTTTSTPSSCAPGPAQPACWPAWSTSSHRRARSKATTAS